jgi:Transposase IS66 family
VWVRAGGFPERKVLLFDYTPSRSAEVGKCLLFGFKGILLTDGYEAYNNVLRRRIWSMPDVLRMCGATSKTYSRPSLRRLAAPISRSTILASSMTSSARDPNARF